MHYSRHGIEGLRNIGFRTPIFQHPFKTPDDSTGAITEEHFDKIFSVNVKGLLFTVQKALPLFQDGGSIILNASAGASKGIEGSSVYSATKVAIRSFARTWTVDLKQHKIRVNAISPGPIDTPMLSGLVQRENNHK